MTSLFDPLDYLDRKDIPYLIWIGAFSLAWRVWKKDHLTGR